jgi:hypothetical protein
MSKPLSRIESVIHDAASAAAVVIMEEFAPHCPSGIAEAMHARLHEIVAAAIHSSHVESWTSRNEPSSN